MSGKPSTRRTILSQRDGMSAEQRMSASQAIATQAEALLHALPAGAIVGLYAHKGTEVDTATIDTGVRARGLRVAYPRIVDGERLLAFHEVAVADLVPARFGLREPRVDAPVVEVTAISAFVIPGVAFDRAGGRIGWGRGHYDATLAGAPGALRIGLSFECQLVERVPRESHDAFLHYVVTEAAVYRGVGH